MKVLDALANGVVFDGVAKPYVPPAKLNVSPKLKLQTAHDEEIDPVTYEVIRHSLWSINEEHGSTIMRRAMSMKIGDASANFAACRRWFSR